MNLLINGNLSNGQALSEKTTKDLVILLKSILKDASKENYSTLKNIKVTYPTKRTNDLVDVYTKVEHKKIVDYILSNVDFKNLGIMICLMTGVRIGEVCALKWSDIDLSNRVISINKTIQRVYSKETKSKIIIDTPKTANSTRDIPIANELYKLLKSLMTRLNKENYVLSNNFKPIEPRTYRKYFDNLIIEVGVKKLKFHALRHTFATRCVESSSDYKTISVILGHSNIATTLNLYVHPNNDQKKNCIEKMYKSLK